MKAGHSKNEETRLDVFDIKGLREILQFSWTAKKINVWVLNKAEIKRELLNIVKAKKPACYGHTTRKQGSCLEKEIMQGTMTGACRRGRPCTSWMDNINTLTELLMKESIRMTDYIAREGVYWPVLKREYFKLLRKQHKIQFGVKRLSY